MKNRLGMFMVGLVIVALFMMFTQKGGEKTMVLKKVATESGVPLQKGEDVIRVFFNLVDEGRVSEVVMMMAPVMIGDETNKQTWGVVWNAFEEIKVKKVELARDNVFKVVLETKMKPGSEDVMPMPFYGYGDGEFIRWVEIEKIGGVFKIKELATGP